MDTSIYNYKAKVSTKIRTTDKNYIKILAEFYKDDIVMPQKTPEQTIITLKEKHNVTMQVIDENH